MAKIIPIPAFSDNYIWALLPDQQGFSVVDPGEARPVLAFAEQEGLKLRSILITHHHADHIGGVEQLKQAFPDCLIYGPVDPRIGGLNHPLDEGQRLEIAPFTFKILATPGHTASHISYYEVNHHWLFCGDTLFSGGCGRVFDGSFEQLYQSLNRYKQLPDDTRVFAAHEYTANNLRFAASIEPENAQIKAYLDSLRTKAISLPSTLALEKAVNPFLRTDSPSLIRWGLEQGIAREDDFKRFCCLRGLKDQW